MPRHFKSSLDVGGEQDTQYSDESVQSIPDKVLMEILRENCHQLFILKGRIAESKNEEEKKSLSQESEALKLKMAAEFRANVAAEARRRLDSFMEQQKREIDIIERENETILAEPQESLRLEDDLKKSAIQHEKLRIECERLRIEYEKSKIEYEKRREEKERTANKLTIECEKNQEELEKERTAEKERKRMNEILATESESDRLAFKQREEDAKPLTIEEREEMERRAENERKKMNEIFEREKEKEKERKWEREQLEGWEMKREKERENARGKNREKEKEREKEREREQEITKIIGEQGEGHDFIAVANELYHHQEEHQQSEDEARWQEGKEQQPHDAIAMYDPQCKMVDMAHARYSALQVSYERPGLKTEPNEDGTSIIQNEASTRPQNEASLEIIEFEHNNPWNTVKGDSQPLYLENPKGLQRTDEPNPARSSGAHESSVHTPISSVLSPDVASPDSGKGSGIEHPNSDRRIWMIGLSALVALPVFAFLWRGIQKDKRGKRTRHPRQWDVKGTSHLSF
jgi:hypothetical protein